MKMKSDIDYLNELYSLIQNLNSKICTSITRWSKYDELRQWIIAKTPLLNQMNAKIATRIFWILNDIHEFPRCKTCGKPLMINVSSIIKGYTIEHCSNRCAQFDPKISNKKKQTCLGKYGVEYAWQSKEVKQKIEDSLMAHYGVKHALASPEVQKKYQDTNMKLYGVKQHIVAKQVVEKAKQTNINNFGVDNPWKLKEIQDKCKQKYTFEGKNFDSAPEIAFYIWLRDSKIAFEYSPNIFFEYEHDGKIWKYYPDFKVGDILYELKGNQFFENKDPAQKMINPYDKSQNDRYEAKHQCMLKNNIVILTTKDYIKYIDYVEFKYGNDYLKRFRNSKEKMTEFKERVSM